MSPGRSGATLDGEPAAARAVQPRRAQAQAAPRDLDLSITGASEARGVRAITGARRERAAWRADARGDVASG